MRFLESLASIPAQDFVGALFVTLTYERVMEDWVKSARDIKVLWYRLQRRFGGNVAMFWRRDLQKRGSIHFHMLLLGPGFVPKEWLAQAWADIVEEARPFTRVERVRSRKGAMVYCAKYMAKVDGQVAGGAGDVVPAPEGLDPSPPLGLSDVAYSTGRCWGLKGRKALSRGEVVVGSGDCSRESVKEAREEARTQYPKVGDLGGFGLFVSSGCQWAEKFCEILGLEAVVCLPEDESGV
jgi:hypothetical protein